MKVETDAVLVVLSDTRSLHSVVNVLLFRPH